jgi:2-succinyl-5-enolpyruvyl-6-hydroxy-3-cyclohexene-1-carboxylate synthase
VETHTRYTVELHPPETGWAELQDAAARARQATEQMRHEGQHVRFLRSVFVPEDDACFFLYEGSSAESVMAAATRAQLGVRRVDEALRLDPEGGETS